MASFIVYGGEGLHGDIFIQGSKNASLPILAATLLHCGVTRIYGCPDITDIRQMLRILEYLGCRIERGVNYIEIDAKAAAYSPVHEEDACQMRSSLFLMGALLGRFGEVLLPYPGGCAIGKRPIDIHLEALRQMNVSLVEDEHGIYGYTKTLTGTVLNLRYPSVGATQNIILAAVKADGKTVIKNAAKEPEIVELCLMLNKMGADIHGMGTSRVTIYGVSHLHDTSFTMTADRIVASTYLAAAAITCGNVRVMNVWEHDIKSVLQVLAQMGCGIVVQSKRIRVIGPQMLFAVEEIHTRPFPGFPTDMQSQILACLSVAYGDSCIYEHIFENRFRIVPELKKMGADIRVQQQCAQVHGVKALHAGRVTAMDLRGGAGLVLAALAAEGKTCIDGAEFIRRGYENICADLNMLGASVEEVQE